MTHFCNTRILELLVWGALGAFSFNVLIITLDWLRRYWQKQASARYIARIYREALEERYSKDD